MFLAFRPARPSDLEECKLCLRDYFAYDNDALKGMVTLWREILRTGAGSVGVIENRLAPPGQRIVWVCVKAFVSPVYALHLQTNAPPFVGRYVVESIQQGISPLLGWEDLRRANTREGVTMLVLTSGAPQALWTDPAMLQRLGATVADFTYYFCGGYRLNEILEEFYDDFSFTWANNAGFRIRRDLCGAYREGEHFGVTLPPGHLPPRLYGITAEEAHASGAGSVFAGIFQYQAPRFGYSEVEQEMLLHSLLDLTDEELAETLHIATPTVKKRWGSIYEKTRAAAPEILPSDDTSGNGNGNGKRGSEKRRYLIQYLRHHLEELRPYQISA